MHGWRVGAVVYRRGLCCTFGWTRKSPWQHTGEGHDGADGYPLTLFHLCLPDRQRYRCDKMSKLDQGPVPGAPLLFLHSLSRCNSLQIQTPSPSHPPLFHFHFLPFTSFSPCLPQAKDQLATFTGQVRGSRLQPKKKLTYLLA